MNTQTSGQSDPVDPPCYADIRDLAVAMYYDTRWSDDDIQQLNDAADMLEFFFGQMQMHSPKMGGEHSYQFRSGGWPMTHCKGPSAEHAVRAAIEEIRRERNQSA
jgi:hypothetical protein